MLILENIMPLVKEIKATANVSFEVILGAFLIAHFADHRESPIQWLEAIL
jgi:hypothetical protein